MKNNKEAKDFFKASLCWVGLFFIMIFCSVITGIDGIFAFIGASSIVLSIVCILAGIITLVAHRDVKVKYKKQDSEEFLVKAKEIEQQFNNDKNEFKALIDKNTYNKNQLVSELNNKKEAKKQYDTLINNFIKANKIKIGNGIAVNMVNDTIEYYNKIIKLENVTGVQVQCNSKIITESNTVEERKARRGLVSTVGRTAVGALVTAPISGVGAVIGLTGTKKTKGMSSTTTTQKEVNSYTVVILTNSIQNSVVTITCGNSEVQAIQISNAINNACINIGTVDTTEHNANLLESAKLDGEIQGLKDKIKEIDKDIKNFNNTIIKLDRECKKTIKQLRKELK